MVEEQINVCRRYNNRTLGAIIAMLAALSAMGMALQKVVAQEINGGEMASGSQINLIDRIRDIETTVKAQVFLLPIILSRGGPPSDGGTVKAAGCSYVTQDPLRIKSLIEILRNGGLNATRPTEPGWIGAIQEGVVLEKPHGYPINFFFTGNYINVGVRGYIDYPFALPTTRTFLTAKASLPEELLTWALAIGASMPGDSGPSMPGDIRPRFAEQIRRSCDYFAARGRK